MKLVAPDATEIVVLPFFRIRPDFVRFETDPLRMCVTVVVDDDDELELPPPPPQAASETVNMK